MRVWKCWRVVWRSKPLVGDDGDADCVTPGTAVAGYGADGVVQPQFAAAKTNIRFMFQAIVTRFHSPRTLSSPRSRN